MKKLSKLLWISVLAMSIYACKDKPVDTPAPSGPTDDKGRVIIDGEIKANRTLVATEKYILKNFVYVTDGVTLTIEPGTVIFGDKDSKATLIVERGGKLIANGTATSPIVFTSAQPKGSRSYGDWGGIVLAGKAPVNQTSPTMEGGIRGSYGGTDAADNSGSLKYVRIEFPGIAFQPDKEINGLTLYGVGSGTTLDYIQVSYSGDDSFEWFGGTVNAKHLVAHRGWDDDFDTDFGFVGKVQYGVSLRDPQYADKSGSNGFESDNFDPGTPATDLITAPVFANISIFLANNSSTLPNPGLGSGSYTRSMHLRRNTQLSAYNSVFVGHPEGLRLDGNSTWANVLSGAITLKGITLAGNATPLKNANPSGETSTFSASDLSVGFNDAAKNNSVVANGTDLNLNPNTFNLTAPNFLPNAGSPLLTGAVWDGKANDAFFVKETFKGAFGTTNWAQGWTNFDPQNTDY
jgi:hypothetical protein